MSKRNKSGNEEDRRLKTIILITAVTNLIKTLIDLISSLIE